MLLGSLINCWGNTNQPQPRKPIWNEIPYNTKKNIKWDAILFVWLRLKVTNFFNLNHLIYKNKK